MSIKARWRIILGPNEAPPQQVAQKVMNILEPFGEKDIEFNLPPNEALSSGSVDFNMPSELMIRFSETERIKLSAASLFNSLNIKGRLIRLGLVNTSVKQEENENDLSRDDSPVRGEDTETEQSPVGVDA